MKWVLPSLMLFVCGCVKGTKIVLTGSTYITCCSMALESDPIPTITYSTGPKFIAVDNTTNRNWRVIGDTTVSNTISIFGVYNSTEEKRLKVDASFGIGKINENSPQ